VMRRVPKVLLYSLLALWTVASLLPMLWMYYSSLKSTPEYTANRWLPTLDLHWQNFVEAWNGITGLAINQARIDIPISQYFVNSLVVVSIAVTLTLLVASLAAYALARMLAPGVRLLIGLLIVALSVPELSLLLPIYAMERQLGLTSTYQGLILPYTAFSIPFATIILLAYFRGIPREFEEAARVDGAGAMDVFLRIILPMSKGELAAVGVLVANWMWNEFLYSLVLMQDPGMRTLPPGILSFVGERETPFTRVLAAMVMSATPIILLFLVFQRQLTKGMELGAGIKG
jgi:ABC-type glycerol-3-phosphate transport system permease component